MLTVRILFLLSALVNQCNLALKHNEKIFHNRRDFILRNGFFTLGFSLIIPSFANAIAVEEDRSKLKVGLEALNDLIENWETKTLNCNFAEIDPSLLAVSNKDELLKKATTNALMQKDSSVILTKCKRDPEIVRLVLGLDTKLNKKGGVPAAFAKPGLYQQLESPDSTLVGADKIIRRLLPVANDIDVYINAEEEWLQAISTIDSASYASGAADFGAIVSTTVDTFSSSGIKNSDSKFLDETKAALLKARDALTIIVSELESEEVER
mmetsp:Transcript_8980/g.11318  ORF Transcript_8980/g.11318 Transcript_8980/m.11318 type:complete len:267 (+) Transcript_8980:53-853(+)